MQPGHRGPSLQLPGLFVSVPLVLLTPACPDPDPGLTAGRPGGRAATPSGWKPHSASSVQCVHPSPSGPHPVLPCVLGSSPLSSLTAVSDRALAPHVLTPPFVFFSLRVASPFLVRRGTRTPRRLHLPFPLFLRTRKVGGSFLLGDSAGGGEGRSVGTPRTMGSRSLAPHPGRTACPLSKLRVSSCAEWRCQHQHRPYGWLEELNEALGAGPGVHSLSKWPRWQVF